MRVAQCQRQDRELRRRVERTLAECLNPACGFVRERRSVLEGSAACLERDGVGLASTAVAESAAALPAPETVTMVRRRPLPRPGATRFPGEDVRRAGIVGLPVRRPCRRLRGKEYRCARDHRVSRRQSTSGRRTVSPRPMRPSVPQSGHSSSRRGPTALEARSSGRVCTVPWKAFSLVNPVM